MTSQSLRAPVVDPPRLAELAEYFAAIGYTEEGVRAYATPVTPPDPWSFASVDVRADASPISIVTKLFYFGVPVERRLADAAFGNLKVSDLEDLGLVEVADGLVRPLSLIRPFDGLLVTSDLPGRVWQHKEGVVDGFTKKYGCKMLVWYEVHETREGAFRRERQMKKWNRQWKIELIERFNPAWRDLSSEFD